MARRSVGGREGGRPAATNARSWAIDRAAVGRAQHLVREGEQQVTAAASASKLPSRGGPPPLAPRRAVFGVGQQRGSASDRGGQTSSATTPIEAPRAQDRATQSRCCASSVIWSRTSSSGCPVPRSADGHAGDDRPAARRQRGERRRRRGGGRCPTRFIGRVGDDPLADQLVDVLADADVETYVQRGRGRTGSVVVLVEPDGERTMLPDRAAAAELASVDESWLDGVTWLHAPAYSLCGEPIGTATAALVRHVQGRWGRISVDVSSVAVVRAFGVAAFVELLRQLRARRGVRQPGRGRPPRRAGAIVARRQAGSRSHRAVADGRARARARRRPSTGSTTRPEPATPSPAGSSRR